MWREVLRRRRLRLQPLLKVGQARQLPPGAPALRQPTLCARRQQVKPLHDLVERPRQLRPRLVALMLALCQPVARARFAAGLSFLAQTAHFLQGHLQVGRRPLLRRGQFPQPLMVPQYARVQQRANPPRLRWPVARRLICRNRLRVQRSLQLSLGSDLHAQPDFVRGVQQPYLTNLTQIHPHRVIARVALFRLQCFLFQVVQLFRLRGYPRCLFPRRPGRCGSRGRIHTIAAVQRMHHAGSLLHRLRRIGQTHCAGAWRCSSVSIRLRAITEALTRSCSPSLPSSPSLIR